MEVIRGCAGMWLEAVSAQDSATPGSEIQVDVTAINRSAFPFTIESIRTIPSNKIEQIATELSYNQPVSRKVTIQIPADSGYSQPYWLRETSSRPFSQVNDQSLIGHAESPRVPAIEFVMTSGQDRLIYVEPVLFRKVDPVKGEVYKDFTVIPEIALNIQDPVVVFPEASPKKIRVQVIAGKQAIQGEVSLLLPAGWEVEPTAHPVNFAAKDETKILTFTVHPRNGAVTGEFRAEAVIGTRKISHGKVVIDYPHIPAQTLFPESKGRLIRVDLKKAGQNIAYIKGPGDAIPEALTQIGYKVTLLSDEDLLTQNLSSYDAILVGIRAYNTRPQLKDAQERLLQYVEQGGTMIVQYQTSQDLVTANLGPYPFRISRRRVSVETAPVTILQPQHTLLNSPNKITPADFEGWVQERGLYFADQWDPRYETILSSADPNEEQLAGGMLFARHGKGIYIFTAYSWFRELPAGVPGAYRLFVNLISAGNQK